MERKRNYIETVRDWADERLRRLFGRITPGKRLAVILVMSALFGGLSLHRETGRAKAANRTHPAVPAAR